LGRSAPRSCLEIVETYRNPDAQYDCIIGVSGGKGQHPTAVWVRDKLGLRPITGLSVLSAATGHAARLLDNLSNLIGARLP